jgi:hypothetical protein
VPLDIHRYFPSEIPLDFVTLIDDLTDLHDFIIRQMIALLVELNPGCLKNCLGGAPPNPIDIGQGNLHSLIFRQVHSSNTRHQDLPQASKKEKNKR